MKKSILNKVAEIYNGGGNIIKYLREGNVNSIEDIMISYDFQAGSYSKGFYENPKATKELCNCFYNYIKDLNFSSMFEAGVGEANKLVTLLENKFKELTFVGGCDLSWSRIKAAQKFAKENMCKLNNNPYLFQGDMQSLPFLDHSIDLVYTMYSLEPNGGREKQLIHELARVARKYVVMLEPSYELANIKQKERMDMHGYVKELPKYAEKEGLEVVLTEKFPVDENPMNPTAITICKVVHVDENECELPNNPFACPVTKKSMKNMGDCFYSYESMLAYPIINEVPCLTEDSAIVATKFNDYN